MGFLIFLGRKEPCIFKVFLTGMKATATEILKLQWRFSWNHSSSLVLKWNTICQESSDGGVPMSNTVWCNLLSFFFIFTCSPWISSIAWTCSSYPFYELTEHPIVHLPPTMFPEKEPPKFVCLTRCCDVSEYTGVITTGWRYLKHF